MFSGVPPRVQENIGGDEGYSMRIRCQVTGIVGELVKEIENLGHEQLDETHEMNNEDQVNTLSEQELDKLIDEGTRSECDLVCSCEN